MKIYHYTSIESLALILKNRTIKFNRLDFVDDLEEGSVESKGVKVGKYIFVSCWTENPEESIPLWKMYANEGIGVRIAIEKDMFRDYVLKDLRSPIYPVSQGEILSKFPREALLDPNYFVMPLGMESHFFYRAIQYTDDVNAKTAEAIKINIHERDKGDMQIAFGEIGRYKHKRWAFQEETRFVVHIMPFNPFYIPEEAVSTVCFNAYMSNKPVPFEHYFMHLKDTAFDDMEITLNPTSTDGQKIIIESLCKLYAPNAEIKTSSLEKIVKLK